MSPGGSGRSPTRASRPSDHSYSPPHRRRQALDSRLMPNLWKQAGIAALALLAATAARWSLDPWLDARVPYFLYVVAIVFIAWRTTIPVVLASLAASWLIATTMFVAPRGGLIPLSSTDFISTVAYFVVTLSIALMAHRLRHAQGQSQSSGQQLDLISNRLPALLSYVGPDRRYVWCNDEYTRWFDLPRTRVVGHTLEEVLGAEAWQRVAPHIDAAFEGRVVEYETEARYARGGTRWIHVTYTPHKGPDGAIHGIVSMVTDISERRRAERHAKLLAGVHESLALNKSVGEAARQVTDMLVREFDLSRCLLGQVEGDADTIRIFHQSSRQPDTSQVGDYRVADFLTEAEERQLAEGKPLVINDVREGRSPEAAALFLSFGVGAVVSAPYMSDGRRKFGLAAEKSAAYAWSDEEVEFFREVAAALYAQFDRARAEQAVRDSERRFRVLASVLTDIPCSIDTAGRFIAHQEAWTRYTGQEFAQARGFGWFDVLHPDDRAPAREAWAEAQRTRQPFEMRARLWNAATAQYRHVIARAAPLVGEMGAARDWV